MAVDQYQLSRQLHGQVLRFLAFKTLYLQLCNDGRQCYKYVTRAAAHPKARTKNHWAAILFLDLAHPL